ncbi:hypothetical protein ACFE04_003463 [Oxalis oulophora]
MASSNSASWMGNSGRKYTGNSRMMNNHSRIEPSIMQCHCGIPIALKTAGTSGNEGRREVVVVVGCLFGRIINLEQAVIIDLLKKMKIENETLMKEVHSIKVEVGEVMTLFKMLARENKMFNGMLLIIIVFSVVIICNFYK